MSTNEKYSSFVFGDESNRIEMPEEIMRLSKGGDAPASIRISFHNGASGIVLHPDGTATTWGSYDPKEAAAEFVRCVLDAWKLNDPQGQA